MCVLGKYNWCSCASSCPVMLPFHVHIDVLLLWQMEWLDQKYFYILCTVAVGIPFCIVYLLLTHCMNISCVTSFCCYIAFIFFFIFLFSLPLHRHPAPLPPTLLTVSASVCLFCPSPHPIVTILFSFPTLYLWFAVSCLQTYLLPLGSSHAVQTKGHA